MDGDDRDDDSSAEPAETPVAHHPLTQFANPAELTYRNELQLQEERFSAPSKWIEIVETDGYLTILPRLARRGIRVSGVGLELGAGMSWLSGQLSAIPAVEQVHALDISERLLSQIAPPVIKAVGGDLAKVHFHAGDFHDLSMFDDGKFDFVVVDAALHHTNELSRVLAEVHRVLDNEGIFLAVNEPGIGRLPITKGQLPNHFGEHERQLGVIENTYPEKQWRRFFEAARFDVDFVPVHHRHASWKSRLVHYSPLRWLNGWLFWSKVIVARKSVAPSGNPDTENRLTGAS